MEKLPLSEKNSADALGNQDSFGGQTINLGIIALLILSFIE